ncbi:MAG TPA: bifunctional glycosyltransferase/class I SAM-dependent methyltransferase [Bryobacteraceae bacterium]|nr:bifunctional glycosyltransferase/class I SAM-dependent methyltransferase [Bryobacteraceae bacterium]
MSDIADTVASPPSAEPLALPFEPLPAFHGAALGDEAAFAQNNGKRIGILIVTYNALTTLTKVLKRITPEVWKNVEEIAVFDDASQDATYELAMGLKTLRGLPKLHVLRHQKNLGYGGNQKAGYRYFMDKGFDAVVLLHGDGQYAPEILSHLYHPIVAGEADAVFGSRMMKTYGGPLKGGMPLYKYVGNRILSIFENRALGLNLTEFHSGYRAYDLHALRKIDFTQMTDDFHFDTEIIIKLQHQRYKIEEVPIPTYYGTEICYVNGMKYALDVFKAVRRYKQTRASVRKYPEFEEYFVHYPIKQSHYSSHYYAQQLTGRNHEVLDIGCGEGFLAVELAKNGNRITGVDALPEAAKLASLSDYYSADLNDGLDDVVRRLKGKRFDRILLLDILEHLRNPERILEQCHDLVERNGQIVVSVPNIANIHVRLQLMFGKFNYTERGLLDRTHVRFYTRKTARALLEQAGYRIVDQKMAVVPIELGLGMSPKTILFKILNRILGVFTAVMPGLFGYQIILVAQSGRNS